MLSHNEEFSLSDTGNNPDDSTTNYGSAEGAGSLGSAEEEQQITSNEADDEDKEKVSDNDEHSTTMQAGDKASNPTGRLASDRRDVGSAPARANEATDRNDSGSGGIAAGGVKSGSSLQ